MVEEQRLVDQYTGSESRRDELAWRLWSSFLTEDKRLVVTAIPIYKGAVSNGAKEAFDVFTRLEFRIQGKASNLDTWYLVFEELARSSLPREVTSEAPVDRNSMFLEAYFSVSDVSKKEDLGSVGAVPIGVWLVINEKDGFKIRAIRDGLAEKCELLSLEQEAAGMRLLTENSMNELINAVAGHS